MVTTFYVDQKFGSSRLVCDVENCDEVPHEEVDGVDEGSALGGAQDEEEEDAVPRQEHAVTQKLGKKDRVKRVFTSTFGKVEKINEVMLYEVLYSIFYHQWIC